MDLLCDFAEVDYHIGEMLMAGFFHQKVQCTSYLVVAITDTQKPCEHEYISVIQEGLM